jgi:hypothetical protein
MDLDDRFDLNRTTFLFDHDRLVAFLRRKPLLGEITSAALQAILARSMKPKRRLTKPAWQSPSDVIYLEAAAEAGP